MSHVKAAHTLATQQAPNAPFKPVAVAGMPTHEDIARRAFDIYIKTGRRQGQCKQNWLQAEKELRNQGMAARKSAQHTDESPVGAHQHQHRHQHQDRP